MPSNSSGVCGVSWNKAAQKWKASVWVGGKEIYLGAYKTLDEAARARKDGELKYWT